MPIKNLFNDFCGNPTPFKCIGSFTEEDSIEKIQTAFESSDLKRKVVEITTSSGKVLQLGENELKDRINIYLRNQNLKS